MTFILGIIAARAGSKRCPGKNIRMLGGKPLVQWTIDAAKASEALTYIIGTTDDEHVMALFANNRVHYLNRPAELATDEASIYDVIFHAVEASTMTPEYVCLLQPTSPFRTGKDIDYLADQLHEFPSCVYAVNEDGKPNGLGYIARLDWLKGTRTFVGGTKILLPQDIDIDTEEDFKRAQQHVG